MNEFSVAEMEQRIAAAVRDLGAPEPAVLVQGPPVTRLGPASDMKNWLPPHASWEDMEDIRIFNDTGEWHAWNLGGGVWSDRMWTATKETRPTTRPNPTFPLWGTRTTDGPAPPGWTEVGEANGARVWVPDGGLSPEFGKKPDAVPVLEAIEIIDYEPSTGLAGVVDCVLRRVKLHDASSKGASQ
jgi:hypothetical protein